MEMLERLINYFKQFENVCIAFSGGADSSLLLHAAVLALGEKNVIAVMVKTQLHTDIEERDAEKFANECGVKLVVLNINPFLNERIKYNDKSRCYHCKKLIFEKIIEYSKITVCDGTNADDIKGYRPGFEAIKELSVKSPLLELGLTKKMVREALLNQSLTVYKKPARPCIATRFPYGTEITQEKIEQVIRGEAVLEECGLINYRLRVHHDIARIETNEPEKLLENKQKILESLHKIGFKFVTLDLDGFRSGSFD